jgi:SAM-dependent methyltransferase
MDYSATRFDLFCSMLCDLGTPLRSGMTLLDFGCGEGRLVQAALALGVDAYGCDLLDMPYSPKWDGNDRLKESARLRAIRNPYELPFKDDSIDVVLSDQVLEHVQNYPQVVAELHRVMRPGACFLHAFPSIYTPLEPHINVPLATVFRRRWWFWFWAILGVRNEYQRGLCAREVVARNEHYLSHGTNYLPPREIRRQFGRGFRNVAFVEHAFLPHSRRPRALARVPGGAAVYGVLCSRFLYGIRDAGGRLQTPREVGSGALTRANMATHSQPSTSPKTAHIH